MKVTSQQDPLYSPDTAVGTPEIGRLIDLQRYPVHQLKTAAGQALVTRCRQQLQDNAIASLPGFIRADAIGALAHEAQALLAQGHRFNQPRSTNFDDTAYRQNKQKDPLIETLHDREHANRYCQVMNHQISTHSDIRTVYRWPGLTEFVRQCLSADTLYPSLCPHLALSMKAAFEGDQDGWHYDPNDGVVTLMLQAADRGGEFEYAPYIRSDNNQNYTEVAKLFNAPEQHASQVRIEPGTFTLFNGRRSMHRVRETGKTSQPRIVAIFCYDARADHVFSQNYIDLVRSFPQGPGTAAS